MVCCVANADSLGGPLANKINCGFSSLIWTPALLQTLDFPVLEGLRSFLHLFKTEQKKKSDLVCQLMIDLGEKNLFPESQF